ncbi:hypothetical protein B0A49_04465 [Cryomyces minteri]|uniref:Endo-beta-1,6-galactanase-like domain-containing protein n=1 Tax=Cryomyces minteri TaxID=331657 RepID=A0A4U0XCK1_9PEZI|nr:hypothetical protein B0A49_04465 [Cryomyces minteri]
MFARLLEPGFGQTVMNLLASKLSVLSAALSTSLTGNAVDVSIKNQPEQTITSFGASGAWWPNDVIHFPADAQTRLGDLLFSKNGLHLSSYRYNMGADGGDDPKQVTNPQRVVESFMRTDGTYDFSRDHAGVTFLQMAQSYAVPRIAFFINAAPSHIADNRQACGWNLTEAKIPAFADYIKTVLSYWKDDGVDVTYISPMNEPDNPRGDCGQEGMAVHPQDRTPAFKALETALGASAASSVGIIGDETSQIVTQADIEDPVWLPSSAPYLSSIAVHNYDYPTDAELALYYDQTLRLTNGHPPPVKFTESCCATTAGSGPGAFGQLYDPTMVNALIVARYVWQFLTIANAQSFDWWTAVANLPCSPGVDGAQCATAVNRTAGYNDGLVYIDPNYNQTHDYAFYPTKRAFVVKHFSHFIRPGSVRYDVDGSALPLGVEALATRSSTRRKGRGAGVPLWNVLFLNNQTSTQAITLRLPGGHAKIQNAVKTTPTDDWTIVKPLPAVNHQQQTVRFTLPAQSMWSMQFTTND